MIDERLILEAALDGCAIARDALDKERRAVMERRKHLPIEHQPLDAGYWYQRECALADEIARIKAAIAELDRRDG